MGISINSNSVTISDSAVSFDDIYQYAVVNNKTDYVKKLGNSYLITTDVYIRNNGHIQDKNITVTIEGELFQIEKGSSLTLGIKRPDNTTSDGCTLNMPNVKLAYGFGNTVISNSGDLFLYNSIINVYGFWGFFEGNNHVEIINCFIDGFGRISGTNSILKNIIFKQANGRYGTISAKGEIKEMSNISAYSVKEYNGLKCSLYHNPDLSGDLTIYYGEYSGYEKLAYIEKEGGIATLELKGTKVLGNYDLYRESDNVDFYHLFRYQGRITDDQGNIMSYTRVVVKDKNGRIEHDVTSDQNGNIDLWIRYYEDIAKGDKQILTPHTIELYKNDMQYTMKLYIDKNFENIPIILSQNSNNSNSDDLEDILTKIEQVKDELITKIEDKGDEVATNVCNCSKTENENVSRKLSQIMIAMSEDIAESTEVIRSHSDISIIA